MSNKVRILVEVVSPSGASRVKATISEVDAEVRRINKATAADKKRTDRLIADSTKARVKEELAEEKRLERDRKKTANEFLASIRKVESESRRSSSRISDAFKGGFLGGFVGAITAQLARLPSMMRSTLDEMVTLAAERQNTFKGLESISVFKGVDPAEAKRTVENLRLVKAGVVGTSDAVVGLRNLLATGFSLPQAAVLMERFSDAAAFGKQAALSYGDALKSAAEGVKNQNSVLVDNIGVTKNLSVILKERGYELEDLSDKVKGQSALLALYNGLVEETQAQVGDADKLTQGWTGSISALSTAKEKLYAAIGDIITRNPSLIAVVNLATEAISGQTAAVGQSDAALVKNRKNWASWAGDVAIETANLVDGTKTMVTSLVYTIAGIVTGAIGGIQTTINAVIDSLNFVGEQVNGLPRPVRLLMGLGVDEVPAIPRLGDGYATIRQAGQLIDQAGKMERDLNERVANRRSDYAFRQEQIAFEQEKAAFETALAGRRTSSAPRPPGGVDPGTFTGGGSRNVTMGPGGNAMKRFFEEELDAVVTSFQRRPGAKTEFGTISKHGSGEAVDIRTRDRTVQEIFQITARALEKGYRLFDERNKKDRPHQHWEANSRRASTFLGAEMYGGEQNLAYLKALDQKRLGRGGVTDDEMERFAAQQSDEITKEERARRMRALFEIYKKMGWTPRGLLDDFTRLLTEDARKGLDVTGRGKGVQPTSSDVASIFENIRSAAPNQPITSEAPSVGGSVVNRLTPGEQFVKNLRISLGLMAERGDEQSRYAQLIERTESFESEIAVALEEQALYRRESRLDLEKEYRLLIGRNKAEDAALYAARERNELQRQIAEAEDRMATQGETAAERYRLAWLDAVNEVRDANIRANESILRSNVILDDQSKVHSEQIRARVLEHLASQRSMSQTIADEIIGVFESAATGIDKLLDKAGIGKIPVLGGIAKSMARQQLTNITRGLLDKFMPGVTDQLEKAENPMLYEAKQHTKLLQKIAMNTSGGMVGTPGSTTGIGGILQSFGIGPGGTPTFGGSGAFGGTGLFSSTGREYLDPNVVPSGGSAGGGSQQGGIGGFLSNLFGGKGGMFGPRANLLKGGKMSKMGGIAGGIGDMATMVGGMIGGKWGNAVSMAGMGISIGANFGPWGALIGGLIGGGAGIISALLQRDDAAKKLKQAAASEFGINVKDKNVLKQLKSVGEGYFGKGQAGKNAVATVRTEEGMNILRAYAEDSGQSGLKIDRLNYGDVNWKGNQFGSQFGGFREMGGDVRRGIAYVVGEKRPELFVPHVNGTVMPAVPNMTATSGNDHISAAVDRLMQVVGRLDDTVNDFGGRINGVSPGNVLMIGARENPNVISEAYNGQLKADPMANERLARQRGEWI